MNDERLPRERRICQALDFQAVYQADCFAADQVLIINGRFNGTDRTRLGLSVSRQVGNSVVRHRWKRRIREAFRQEYPQLPVGVDLVVRPKRGARLDFAAIRQSLPRLAQQVAQRLARRSPSASSSSTSHRTRPDRSTPPGAST
ncbi:MAG: ribonuclease P protein component [Planctomycetota bacterium]